MTQVQQLNLGIIWKDGKIINHRSLFKVLCNPILRCFGWQIVSIFVDNKINKIQLMKIKPLPLKWSFVYNVEGCIIEKKRIIV
jgi:hypothetical protein